MVGIWSVPVFCLIAQLAEFKELAGNTHWVGSFPVSRQWRQSGWGAMERIWSVAILCLIMQRAAFFSLLNSAQESGKTLLGFY